MLHHDVFNTRLTSLRAVSMAFFEGLRADGTFFSSTGSRSNADRNSTSLEEGSSNPESSSTRSNESDSEPPDESLPASTSGSTSSLAPVTLAPFFLCGVVPPFVLVPSFLTGASFSSALAKSTGGYPKQEVSTRHCIMTLEERTASSRHCCYDRREREFTIQCNFNAITHPSLSFLLAPHVLLPHHVSLSSTLPLTWRTMSNVHRKQLGTSPGVSSDSDFLFRELARLGIAAVDHQGQPCWRFVIVTYDLQC